MFADFGFMKRGRRSIRDKSPQQIQARLESYEEKREQCTRRWDHKIKALEMQIQRAAAEESSESAAPYVAHRPRRPNHDMRGHQARGRRGRRGRRRGAAFGGLRPGYLR